MQNLTFPAITSAQFRFIIKLLENEMYVKITGSQCTYKDQGHLDCKALVNTAVEKNTLVLDKRRDGCTN